MNERECTRLVRIRATTPIPDINEHHRFLPCEHCGRFTYTPERHHRRFRSRGGDWTPANILLLCGPCHHAATNEHPTATADGLNVSSSDDPTDIPVRVWHTGLVYLNNHGEYTPHPR